MWFKVSFPSHINMAFIQHHLILINGKCLLFAGVFFVCIKCIQGINSVPVRTMKAFSCFIDVVFRFETMERESQSAFVYTKLNDKLFNFNIITHKILFI